MTFELPKDATIGWGEQETGLPEGAVLGWDNALEEIEEPEIQEPERTALGTMGDILVTGAKGVVGTGEAVMGLADIATLGRSGKIAEKYLGYDPEQTHRILSSLYSPAQQEANKKVEETKGFVNTVSAMLRNPSTLGHTALESVPLMLGGAAVGRTLIGTGAKLAPWVAASIGEGLAGAGTTAESIRQQTEDGVLTPKQAGVSVVSGVGTSAFGMAGGRLANKLGLTDIDTFLVNSRSNVTPKGVIKRIVGGGISEGAFEELPQSVQEQIWQNSALDKPLLEGVPESAAKGILTGAVMGSGANVLARQKEVDPAEALINDDEAALDAVLESVLTEDAYQPIEEQVIEPEARPFTEEEIQMERDILAQREGPTQQEINQARIKKGLSDIELQEREEKQDSVIPSDRKLKDLGLQEKLDTMQQEVNSTRTKGVTQAIPTMDKEGAIAFSADSPRWMQQMQLDRKNDGLKPLNRIQLNALFNNIRAGKELTDIQQEQYNYLEKSLRFILDFAFFSNGSTVNMSSVLLVPVS